MRLILKRKVKDKIKKIAIICWAVIVLIIVLAIYIHLIHDNFARKKFVEGYMKIYENNTEQVFKIDKIVLCSSANALDLSEEQNLQNLTIYQYTDIAVYIDNGDELTNKNTIKELYIDNISLQGLDGVGQKSLTYKNILDFGLDKSVNGNIKTNDINFNIVYTNEENAKADYDKPTFFTDCSNPITLGYLNYDLASNYKMDENKTVAFDGNLLADANVAKENIDCRIKFKINILNNNDEYYSCWANFKIPLDDIYEKGTTMKSKTTNGENKYVFFRG